ncbi:hypothetical protein LTR28_012018 [Elasticomyces elasticus]|nr:hypothetical protein LTR28_012018 [Elasticomyces elasticus]
MLSSDVHEVNVCGKCGMMGYQNWCRSCKSSGAVVKMKVPYAAKLLIQELMSMNIKASLRLEDEFPRYSRTKLRISIDMGQTPEAMIDRERRSHYHTPTPSPHDMHAQNHSAIAIATTDEEHKTFPPSPPPSTSPRPRTVPPTPAGDGMSAEFT